MNDNEKYIAEYVRDISFEDSSAQHRDALKAQLLNAFPGRRLQSKGRARSTWRVIIRTPIAKLAAAAAIISFALFLWRATEETSKGYTLSDVPRLLEQARTTFVKARWYRNGEGFERESWTDLENGRIYHSWEESASEEGPNGGQVVRYAIVTVCDGQFVMRVDHGKRTVRFGRVPASQKEPWRLILSDRASKEIVRDMGSLRAYTRVDKEKIDGELYDVWRAEFNNASAGVGIKCEYWVSPLTGAVGRTRQWHKYGQRQGWELLVEGEKYEVNVQPPADIFATEPPAGYTLENQKAAADMIGWDLDSFRSAQGHVLSIPASFTLEDGSVLVCWRGTSTAEIADPNAAYQDLSFGGDLPEAPTELFALMSQPGGDKPGPMIDHVGRHLMATRAAGRVYEWALYVPPHPVIGSGVADSLITVIRLNAPDPVAWLQRQSTKNPTLRVDPEAMRMQTWGLTSFRVTAETFAQYVPAALRELSEGRAPAEEMTYEKLLALAERVRAMPELYEAVHQQVKEAQDHVAVLEPVKPEEITTPEQVHQQAKELVEAFYAAVIDGRDAEAVKLLRYEEPRASRAVAGMKELPGVKDIRVEHIYAADETALVITSEFAVHEGRSGRWAIGIIKEKGTWLIKDFDATTTDTMREEVDDYLQHFPGAKHFTE